MASRTWVIALACISLVGCSSTRTLDGDAADWNSTLDTGDRITIIEESGRKVAVRYETIEDGVLYGALYDDAGSAYSIPVDDIEKLEVDATGSRGTGKTLAMFGLVVLGVALIDALQDIPPGWPAYQ